MTPPPQRPRRADPTEFLNPYNFVATPPRDRNGALGDRVPDTHDRFHRDRFTGQIPITLTTRTPLLLPDQAGADPATKTQPKTAGTRRRGSGRDAPPLLTGSTVKGVLRSAYEAITNSRYGVISEQHSLPVVVRQSANSRVLNPAVVTHVRDGQILVTAVRRLGHKELRNLELDPTPWLPRELGQELATALELAGVDDLDCQEVDAWIHAQIHPGNKHHPALPIWRVSDIAPVGTLPNRPTPLARRERASPLKVRGRIHWTHATFPAVTDPQDSSKHDERLFVTEILDGPADFKPIHEFDVAEHAPKYVEVIDSYIRAHEHDTDLRPYGSYVWARNRWHLTPGRTLYIEFDGRSRRVVNMTPAMISRVAFPATPAQMISDLHRRPTTLDDLSPADRVFGWTHPEVGDDAETGESTAYRANIRVDPPECAHGPAVSAHDAPVWLATLNSPKPQQFRFYTGSADTEAGYRGTGVLRGRKFYLPHRDVHGDNDYWTPRAGTRNREYVAPQHDKPQLRLAVKSWVPAETTFTTTLWVHNISRTELAALLWLLTLPADAVYGVGLGKPLGFGSTRIDVDWDHLTVHTHEQLLHRYRTLAGHTPALTTAQDRALVTEFEKVLHDCGLATVRDEFLDAVTGFTDAPVHYPRLGNANGTPGPRTEKHYEWFVANGKSKSSRVLPELGKPDPPTLPRRPR